MNNQWRTGKSGYKGKGAINLVMYLSGYGQDQYQQAVRDMAEVFGGKEAIVSTLAAHLVSTASREATNIIKQKFEMPKSSKLTWPGVCGFLRFQMKMPEIFVDELHDQGLVFSDPRGNCVFARDQDSGVFKVGTGDKPFNQALGKCGGPFIIPGNDGKAYVTDLPLEALSLKLLHPDSTVLATGGYMAADKLKPYLVQKEIYLAPSQDKIGKQMGEYLSEVFPKAKRIQPGQAASWNEYRQLQIEERDKEKKRAQAAAKAQFSALAETAGISRSTGLSR